MRIRLPFACAFLVLLSGSAYLGLSRIQIQAVNDKVLHFLDFFALTLCFYWVLDTTRRRILNLTLIVCTITLAIGSEFVQGVIPNGRSFDPYDILSNIVGSVSALVLCSWYHKRMLERRRKAKLYHIVPGDEEGVDVELGEGAGSSQSGEDVLAPSSVPSIEADVDNWDENAEDNWDVSESPEGEQRGSKHPDRPAEGKAVQK